VSHAIRFGRRVTALLLCSLTAASACAAPPAADTRSADRSASAAPTPATPTAPATTAPATTAPPAAAGSGTGGAVPARPDHIVVAVFENKDYSQIKGNPKAPYLNALVGRAATFTNAHGVAHPSQPNYLALFSGSTQGVTDDRCLSPMHGKPNLGTQLIDAGYTFTGYSEDLPAPGFPGCRYDKYAAKHNPWVDFDNVPKAANQPYTAWPTDFTRLPTMAFVVPNLCNDMHDCGIAAGDTWAKAHLDPYLRWADTHNSLLVVTFDENDGSSGNQILTLIAGAGVRPAIRTESIDHYTLLRTIENMYGLAPIGHAATATPISGLG
jgi:acid phosphatase